MNLLGIYLGQHDSNMCAVSDGQIRYRKFERRSGVKHERVGLNAIHATCDEWKFIPEWIAYSDGNRNGLGSCAPGELFQESRVDLGFGAARKTFCLDHHFAHILSAWPCAPSGLPSLGIALDGRGDHGIRARVIRLDERLSPACIFESTELAIGRFFTLTGRHLGLGGLEVDLAGKVMGAQALGSPDPEFIAHHLDHDVETLPRRLLGAIPWRGAVPIETPGFFCVDDPSFRNWLASCHTLLSYALEGLFARFCSPDMRVVYAGGCAQNAIFNRALARRFPGLVVPPHAYDGGISLGCIELLRRNLGAAPFIWNSFPFAQDDESIPTPSVETVAQVADLLAKGRVVGWMCGHGEIGPRALGHRSILFDPRSPYARAELNRRVKLREPWRPYAASILAERASEWFDIAVTEPQPYMVQAIQALPKAILRLPGVVHRDGTCRIQKVEPTQDLRAFRELLARFEERTGIPALLNTSLNGAGEPIHGWAAQAESMFEHGCLDAICIGDRLLIRT